MTTPTNDTTTTDPAAPEVPADAPAGDTALDTLEGTEIEPQDAADDDTKAGRLRHRAQLAEQERDRLQAMLDGTQRGIVDASLIAAGFDSERLRTAAGIDLGAVRDDDGLIDAEKLNAAVQAAAADLHVKPPSRRPLPLPIAGTGEGGRRSESGKQAWDSAFEPMKRRG